VPFLLLGIVTIGWAGFSLLTGKGYYKGCPPGGYDRAEHPFTFWVRSDHNHFGYRCVHDSDLSGMDSVAVAVISALSLFSFASIVKRKPDA
jgi:hypothetical protein